MSLSSKRLLALLTLLLLFIAASRILRVQDMRMDVDEVWTVWQTYGTPAQILAWTPYDWPPLSYLMVGAWRVAVGIHPFAIHMLPIFIGLLGSAFTFACARRFGTAIAVLAMLAYSALAFATYLSLTVRGYVIVLALLPCLLWLTQRYFERPTLMRAIWLALCLAAMFYTYLTSALAFGMIGLYTLFVYPRRIWRWWLPGIIAAMIALPEIISKAQLTISRTAGTATLKVFPLPEALVDLFHNYVGYWWPVWVILLFIAILIIWRRQVISAPLVLFLLWVALMPLILYVLNPILGFFSPRYAWWLMFGLAMLVAWGLGHLPDRARWLTGAVLAITLFQPLPLDSYQIPGAPIETSLTWLTKHLQAGDVMILDPNNTTVPMEEWDYFTHVYFPNGLTFVDAPADHRRVWYATRQGQQVPELEAAVNKGRLPGEFVGPWDFLIRLYEAPPDAAGLAYANGMRFHGVDVIKDDQIDSTPLVRREAEPIRLRLWWSVAQPIPLDYSISTVITSKTTGETVASFDGPPQLVPPDDPSLPPDPRETSRWQLGRYYIEDRTLTLPYPTANGQYDISMIVYFYADGKPVSAAGVNADGRLLLKTLTVKAW